MVWSSSGTSSIPGWLRFECLSFVGVSLPASVVFLRLSLLLEVFANCCALIDVYSFALMFTLSSDVDHFEWRLLKTMAKMRLN